MDKIIEMLKASGADAWEIIDTKTKGWEFYFIRHHLDQNRAKDVEHILVKVYKLHGGDPAEGAEAAAAQYMGVASTEFSPTDSPEEMKKAIDSLVYKASLVNNPPYRLNTPKTAVPLENPLRPLSEEAADFIGTMNRIAETDTEDLNSYEIFTNAVERRLVNSEGIDITERYPSSMVEVVINARKDGHEIELYRLYDQGSCDSDGLKRDVDELLQFGKDRLRTKPTPALGEAPVVFSTDAAVQIYAYFLDNLNTAYQVRHLSPFVIGSPIAEEIRGDRITLESVRVLPGSPENFAYDGEGAPIRDAVLIEDSVPKEFVGGRMFSQYMGLEDAFSVSNWRVRGGAKSADELRTGRFLEIVEFSDFQVDSMTGDIFGEIRLGYFHDGEGNVTPVSGGSVSGNMADNVPGMYLSRETRRYSCAEIPSVTRLEKISIAGAAKD